MKRKNKKSIMERYESLLNKDNMYSCENLIKARALINLIISGRGTGKSYDIKCYLLNLAIQNNDTDKFMYLRHVREEISTDAVTEYFADTFKYLNKEKYPFLAEYDGVATTTRGYYIYVYKLDADGNQVEPLKVGKSIFIKNAITYKSRQYPEYSKILFEEFARLDLHIKNEIYLFESIVSTVIRHKENGQAFLIGNLIDQNSIYYRHYELLNEKTQENGTIDIYKIYSNPPVYNEDGEHQDMRLALEKVLNKKDANKILFGRAQAHTSGNVYEQSEKPLISQLDLELEVPLYSFVVENGLLMFLVKAYINKRGNLFFTCTPKTTELQANTRLISDRINESPYATVYFKPLSQEENTLFIRMKHNIYYSDNLTGTQFEKVLNDYRIAMNSF